MVPPQDYLSSPVVYKQSSRVEEGSNTSTVAQRVVGGDEKATQCLGALPGHLFMGDINTRTWPCRLGKSRI
jgi:hypothetical protein